VDTVLSKLPGGVIEMKILGWHDLRKAEVLYVRYPNNVFVQIFVRTFRYMNPNSSGSTPPHLQWDFNLFKKESVAHVIVFNDTICVNGCQYLYK